MKPLAALWRFVVAAAVAAVLLILITNVIRQPVDGQTRTFTADFSDVSGLQQGADVRVHGVRVGKVTTIDLQRANGRSFASVMFTLEKRFGVVPASRLAVKYQALTGLRYLDASNVTENGDPAGLMTHIPMNMTQPSFDITTLFNGLQPVLATLSPDDINRFTDNVATVLAGDGNGLGPLLDSIRHLTQFVGDRETVIATLLRNLTTLANGVQGRSDSMLKIIDLVNVPVDAAISVLDEFRKSQIYGEAFTGQIVRLLYSLGIKPGADLDRALDKAFTNLDEAIDGFKRIPVIMDNIQPPTGIGEPVPCAHGRAQLPAQMDVLLNGQRVMLCNQ